MQARQNACNWGEAYPPYFEEELACLSDRPLLHLNGSRLAAGGLARVRAGWMGLGPRCRGIPDGCYAQGSGRLPPTPQLVAGFRRLLGRCLGFPEGAAAPLQPLRVMVVDRPYAGSRWAGVWRGLIVEAACL